MPEQVHLDQYLTLLQTATSASLTLKSSARPRVPMVSKTSRPTSRRESMSGAGCQCRVPKTIFDMHQDLPNPTTIPSTRPFVTLLLSGSDVQSVSNVQPTAQSDSVQYCAVPKPLCHLGRLLRLRRAKLGTPFCTTWRNVWKVTWRGTNRPDDYSTATQPSPWP